MGDMTQLELAKFHLNLCITRAGILADILNVDGRIDCTEASNMVRSMRSALDNTRDHIFAVNREQQGSDEAIQKQQILYRKEQERKERERLAEAERLSTQAAKFSLD